MTKRLSLSNVKYDDAPAVAVSRRNPYDGRVSVGVGHFVKAWRKRAELSQEALGKELGHKRPTTVQAWEVGRRSPKAGTLRKIATILQASDQELREALALLVGIDGPSRRLPAPQSAIRPPSDPLLSALGEALLRASPEDRLLLWTLVNLIRERLGLPAIEPSRAPRRVGAR